MGKKKSRKKTKGLKKKKNKTKGIFKRDILDAEKLPEAFEELIPQLPNNEPNAKAPNPMALSFKKCRLVCCCSAVCSASFNNR